MSCFYFCFFLLIFVFKVLGSPFPLFRGRRASPDAIYKRLYAMLLKQQEISMVIQSFEIG